MPITKAIPDNQNYGMTLGFWEVAIIQIMNTVAEKAIRIILYGYENEASRDAGNDAIDDRQLVIPLENPEIPDEFDDVRDIVISEVNTFLSRAENLARRFPEWNDEQ